MPPAHHNNPVQLDSKLGRRRSVPSRPLNIIASVYECWHYYYFVLCHSNPQCDNSMSLGQRTNVPDTDTISFLYAYCEEERIMTVDLCIDVVRFLTCQKNCNYCQRRWRRQQGNCDCSCICICIFICLYLSNVSQQWHQHNKSTNCCKLCWRH